jgi:methylmalonyl-CoA mutase N-terminal domain/subunit
VQPSEPRRLRGAAIQRDHRGLDHCDDLIRIPQTRDTARGTGNLMPVIVEAVEADATVGEISDAMRRVYGEYRERVVI